jgi:Lrp/AsnC family transcriptional regulator for asnA, asnC and gidA
MFFLDTRKRGFSPYHLKNLKDVSQKSSKAGELTYLQQKIYHKWRTFFDMDDKDMKIIAELVRDARTTLSELSEILGMSISSIHKRIKKLESGGVIEKYSAVINPDKFDSVTAFLLISAEDTKKVFDEIKQAKDVVEVYKTLGNFSMVAKVRSKNLDRIGEITSKISAIEGVMMVECIVTTRRLKEEIWTPDLEVV